MRILSFIIILIGIMGLFPSLAYLPVVELLTDISILVGDVVYKTTDLDVIKAIYQLLCYSCIAFPISLNIIFKD